jgi:hypothetical protein
MKTFKNRKLKCQTLSDPYMESTLTLLGFHLDALHTALSVCWIIASFQHEDIFLEGYGQIQNKMVGYELFTR